MGKGATRSTLVVWSSPSREVRHRHHSAAQHPTAEPSTQYGAHWRRRSKQIRISAIGPVIWEGDENLRSRGHWYGLDRKSLGIGPPLDAVSLDDLGHRFASRTQSEAAVCRRTFAPEHSCAWHPQPRYGRAPAELGLSDTDLARTSDTVMVPHVSSTAGTRRDRRFRWWRAVKQRSCSHG